MAPHTVTRDAFDDAAKSMQDDNRAMSVGMIVGICIIGIVSLSITGFVVYIIYRSIQMRRSGQFYSYTSVVGYGPGGAGAYRMRATGMGVPPPGGFPADGFARNGAGSYDPEEARKLQPSPAPHGNSLDGGHSSMSSATLAAV